MKKPEAGPASEAGGPRPRLASRTKAGLPVSLGRGNEVKVKRPPPNAARLAATEIAVEFGLPVMSNEMISVSLKIG